MKKKVKEQKVREKEKVKRILEKKKLLRVVKDSSGLIKDGILLFGKYKDKRILELLDGFESSSYVINYLSGSKDLPVKFRRVIKMIIENYDPFSFEKAIERSGVSVREVDPEDDIPW